MKPDTIVDSGNDATHSSIMDAVITPLIDHRQAFHAFLTRRLGNTAVAEDLLQQCFIKAMSHHHSL